MSSAVMQKRPPKRHKQHQAQVGHQGLLKRNDFTDGKGLGLRYGSLHETALTLTSLAIQYLVNGLGE
jgi:hypothetical protein